MIEVSRARPEDFADIIALGHRMQAESAVPYPPVDDEKFTRSLHQSLATPALYAVFVARLKGEAVGFVTAIAGEWMYCTERFAMHDILYVRPASRGTRAAVLLVEAFHTWAATNGVQRTIIGVHTGLNTDRTGGFYESMGYRYMGGCYYRGGEWQ
ncbi:MAG: GNAT family N-acetyltransferase [bacterium]|nr:GNAT family N-acetyltransferase [bacterium]